MINCEALIVSVDVSYSINEINRNKPIEQSFSLIKAKDAEHEKSSAKKVTQIMGLNNVLMVK